MYLWDKKSPANLGAYRPNQAVNRVYSGYAMSGLGAPPVFSIAQLKAVRPLSGMGAFGDTSDPTTWLAGAAVLGLGWLLLRKSKGGGTGDKRRIAQLGAQRALATRALRESGA
jgi:hypothetical protein